MLTELYFEDNKLKTIEDFAFVKLEKLKLLSVARNNVEHVSTLTFTGLTGLQTLILSDNKIVSFSQHILRKLIQLKQLDLTRNPLQQWPENQKNTEIIYAKVSATSLNIEYALLLLTIPTIAVTVLVFYLLKRKSTIPHKILIIYTDTDCEYGRALQQKLDKNLHSKFCIDSCEDIIEPGKVNNEEMLIQISRYEVIILILSNHINCTMDLILNRLCDNPIRIKEKVI